MPDIRYVCLSDVHLGAANSLLSNLQPGSTDVDTATPSPVLVQLVRCLRELISHNEDRTKPTLILNGDILELALAKDNIAAMTFERFVDLIMPADVDALFAEQIIYIPGNHDHHLWETARETQYVNFIARKKWGDILEVPWHATKMFAPDPVSACLMNGLLRRYPHANGTTVTTVYPNFGVASADGRRCVLFSHGHFTEPMYLLMTSLTTVLFPQRQAPTLIWDLEAENFAWIDFFWSTMGRSGSVGSYIGLLYEKLNDPTQLKKLVANVAAWFAQRPGVPYLRKHVEAFGVKMMLGHLLGDVSGLERRDTGEALTSDGETGLRAYLEGPLKQQVLIECDQTMPPDVTFVFGHTHKPFERQMHFRGYPDWVGVYNSGGWVVDTVTRAPVHGGAVILVDENLNTASLRCYNEAEDADGYAVRIEAATHPGAGDNPFHRRLRELVDPSKDPWKSLSATVARMVPIHADNLREEINRD